MSFLNRSVRVSLLAVFVIAVSACGPTNEVRQRLSELDRGLEDLRGVQAEQVARLDNLESQMRAVYGKVEEVEFAQTTQIQEGVTSLQRDISRLTQRVPPPALVPVAALETDEVLARKFPPELERIFSNALTRIRTGDYREALPFLDDGLRRSVGTQFTGFFQFWAGISYEGSGQNKEALSIYHQLVTESPTHPRAPLALLRQGSVFVRLKDTSAARLTYQKLIAEYPTSNEAAQAREKIKKLR